MDPISRVSGGERLPDVAPAKMAPEADRLRDAARELEGVFIGLLMKAMRSTVGSGGLFKEDMSAQTYRDMFDQEIGRSMARAGGIGLAQMVLRDQLLRQTREPAAISEGGMPIQPAEISEKDTPN
jgi:flagellar protein FlgJ